MGIWKSKKYRPVHLPVKPKPDPLTLKTKRTIATVLQKWAGKPPDLPPDDGWMK